MNETPIIKFKDGTPQAFIVHTLMNMAILAQTLQSPAFIDDFLDSCHRRKKGSVPDELSKKVTDKLPDLPIEQEAYSRFLIEVFNILAEDDPNCILKND